MQVVILAGGKGVRLKPFTVAFPKALVPVGTMPILEIVLRQLKFYGVTEVVLSVGHLAPLIEAYFGNGEKHGIKIRYVIEEQPLGTAGPLHLVEDLAEDFLVMNADILTDLSYLSLMEEHFRNKATATLAVYERESYIDFGTLEMDPETNQVKAFREKPMLKHTVSMGVYAFNRKVLEYIPKDTFFGFDDLMYALIDAGEHVSGYSFNGYWLDIGRPDDYEKAQADFEMASLRFLPEHQKSAPDATGTLFAAKVE